MPPLIYQVDGIRVFGRTLRSFIFSTDIALIRNTNADAVLGMYPFATQPVIHRALLEVADMPVFVGVGSTNMDEDSLIRVAEDAEGAGAAGVVVGAHVPNWTLSRLKKVLDIPLVVTVASEKENLEERVDNGADILNISGAQHTPAIVHMAKQMCPYVPVIATGGPSEATILETIRAGADAISFTPPSVSDIFSKQMEIFRDQL